MAQRPGIDWGRACLSAVCYLRRLWAVVDTPVRPTNGIAGVLNCSAVVRWPASVCSSGLVFNCCRTSSSRPLGVYLPCARPNTIDRITCRMGLAVWAIKARRADGMGVEESRHLATDEARRCYDARSALKRNTENRVLRLLDCPCAVEPINLHVDRAYNAAPVTRYN